MKHLIFGFLLILFLGSCISPYKIDSPYLSSKTNDMPDVQQLSTETIEYTETILETIDPSGQGSVVSQAIPTPYVELRYGVQPGTPKVMENFAHPEAECDWMGVGGQILDLNGNPVTNLVVKLEGTLAGDVIEMVSLSGGALYLGPGGYEFKLSDHPIESDQSLRLTIYDSQGNSLSTPVIFSSYDTCDTNFVLVNFIQLWFVMNSKKIFLPSIYGEPPLIK